ncbi:MAG: sigma 54-interacting transcriptional regulator [Planctomycetota bacterium]|nr:sigma 54-interacting transcriptional regulator [Planctomycetota bacterium]MDA1165185.1 sigma 54-interacting transcriptional regulator [Planctomycetota bacterium]
MLMEGELARPKLLVVGLGVSVVIYTVLVLGYVGTTPDIGIRGLISDADRVDDSSGMVVRRFSDFVYDGNKPVVGDVLVRIHDRPVRSFIDFCSALQYLRDAPIKAHGILDEGTRPSDYPQDMLPSLLDIGGDRTVEVEFIHNDQAMRGWIVIQSMPLSEVLLSFIWLVLQFAIFAISALAAWHRPFDRTARLFFAMCAVAMAAFIGGFHWWVIASSPLLNIPFLVCALLTPAVSVHFFLSYPRPLGPMDHNPRQAVAVIYAVPSVTAVVMTGLLISVWGLTGETMSTETIQAVAWCLAALRETIYGYLAFAALCFCVMVIALATEYLTASSPSERNQIKWMFLAGVISAIPVTYTLYLALFDRTAFALGSARIPMFLASLSFTLAYTVGIVRFKLMLVDEFVTRGMLYHLASQGLTIGYGVCVALATFFANDFNVSESVPGVLQQVLSIGVLLTFLVVVLTWSRDRLQRSIDRRFYREKYQLDRALQRVNRAMDQLEDRHSLGQRMLASCREVLGADMGALYLREPGSDEFQLVAMDGAGVLPERFPDANQAGERLKLEVTIQRATAVAGDPQARTLRDLRSELMFPLIVDDEVEGIAVLGKRHDGTTYTAEDLTFLHTLAQFTGMSLRSVKVHQDFARLNDEISMKAGKIDEQRQQIAIMQAELTGNTKTRHPEQSQELRRDMIKGNSPAIRRVLDTVQKVAVSESTVLIQGASGTGKELLAQALHENSPRRNGPLIRVHCAALSPSLLESELFGHVKGAFTGAHKDRVGRFEMAHGGTLFLDEIGDISLETQIKLLRVLQTRSFEAVGGTKTVDVDVRLITATHQDLHHLISEGRFREDLFYRLNVVNITLPTLSERTEDLFELSLYFLKKASEKLGKRIAHIDEQTLEAMKHYRWPGNIRELENLIERAVVMCDGETITLQDLPDEVLTAARKPQPQPQRRAVSVASSRSPSPQSYTREIPDHEVPSPPPGVVATVRSTMAESFDPQFETELETLQRALRESGGNKSKAARSLGIPRSTLFSRLKKVGLT